MKTIEFEPWFGELGWEVMTWAPYCRKIAQEHDKAIVTSFKDMKPLYEDFAEFVPNDESDPRTKGRGLKYPKRYRLNNKKMGEYFKYGNPNPKYDIILHMRGCRKKSNYNYTKWKEVIHLLEKKYDPKRIACVGGFQDKYVNWLDDQRMIPLQDLMDLMAGAKVTVGVSSGVMHLAMACGCPVVVWGDNRTYFGETLEKRYKETWNPFGTKVYYLMENKFQPKAVEIVREVGNGTRQ